MKFKQTKQDSVDRVELATFKPSKSHFNALISNLSPTNKVSKQKKFGLLLLLLWNSLAQHFATFHLLFVCGICLFSFNEQTNNFRQKSAEEITTLHPRQILSLTIFPLHFVDDGVCLYCFCLCNSIVRCWWWVMVVDSFFTSFGLIEYFGKLPYVLCTEMRILQGIAILPIYKCA